MNNQESLSKTDFEQQWEKPSVRQLAREKYSKEIRIPAMSIKFYKVSVDPSPLEKLLIEAKKWDWKRC